MRRTLILAAALVLLSMAGGAGAGGVLAAPDNVGTVTYSFHDCTGLPGAPTAFDAVKQPSGAAALHVVGARFVFVVMAAEDVETGDVSFSTPGFAVNGLPTLTCLATHPSAGRLQLVGGLLSPRP